MSSPLVSFVVLSYNFAPFLEECIASILNQEHNYDIEIVLVDDASSDDSDVVLRSFQDRRITVIRHERNLGHIATVTDGLSHARGKYIARIDGDDRYQPTFLSHVVPILESHPEVGLTYGDAAIMDERGIVNAPQSDRVHNGTFYKGNEFVALLEQNFICAPTIIARRETWLRCLPIPAGLAFHDWYFTLMIARCHDFYYINHVLADYRVHSGNHHTRVIRDKSEEPSILRILDGVFGERESSPILQRRKEKARRRIYARHYVTLGDKYFGLQMNEDARRCYAAALQRRPSHLLNAGLVRRLAATLVGRARYDAGKTIVKAALGRSIR